jgi:hypothetical protein
LLDVFVFVPDARDHDERGEREQDAEVQSIAAHRRPNLPAPAVWRAPSP